MDDCQDSCTAFEGSRRIAAGGLIEVASKAKAILDGGASAPVLVFDDATSRLIEIDFRGTADEVIGRIAARVGANDRAAASAPEEARAPRGPGRPRLGVVAREVTLLPRHWEWLNGQPGGASVALRKLVEDARKANQDGDRLREAREAAYRFMSAMAGDRPGFEEATRALFAGDRARFDALIEPWPADIGGHARKLSATAFAGPPAIAEPAEQHAPGRAARSRWTGSGAAV